MDKPASAPARRIGAIDLARGAALIAMAIYHFTWDLQFFGFVEPGTATSGGWKMFARLIASTFLFLAGVSLALAHRSGIRWDAFRWRMLQVIAAALLVTVATWWATPSNFVFFGILHHIALASLVGLLFVNAPAWAALAAAVAVFGAGQFLASPVFDNPALWWVGMADNPPVSNDYVPLFPWFSAVLAGIGIAKACMGAGLDVSLANMRLEAGLPRALQVLGRHGLLFYLVHQPVLIALVAAAAWLFPPDRTEATQGMILNQCQESCELSRDGAFCLSYCACFVGALESEGDLGTVLADTAALEASGRMEDITAQCSASAETEAGQ